MGRDFLATDLEVLDLLFLFLDVVADKLNVDGLLEEVCNFYIFIVKQLVMIRILELNLFFFFPL